MCIGLKYQIYITHDHALKTPYEKQNQKAHI